MQQTVINSADVQGLFDRLINLLKVNIEHSDYVQEILDYYPSHEIDFGSSVGSESRGNKEHILNIYESRAGMEVDLRPHNNYVIGYHQLLPKLRATGASHIRISNIRTDVGTFIIFSDEPFTEVIGILKSKNTLAEVRKKQDNFNHLLPQVNYYKAHEQIFSNGYLVSPIIIDYLPEHQALFKQLNEEWISKHFRIEDSDHKVLNAPQEYILDKGGFILMALYQNEVVGTVALIPLGNKRFELAKMAVAPRVQGKKIGWILGQQAIFKAWYHGAETLYLESNTKLIPAINLYHKLGFKEISSQPTPYQRCNIQMELKLR